MCLACQKRAEGMIKTIRTAIILLLGVLPFYPNFAASKDNFNCIEDARKENAATLPDECVSLIQKYPAMFMFDWVRTPWLTSADIAGAGNSLVHIQNNQVLKDFVTMSFWQDSKANKFWICRTVYAPTGEKLVLNDVS